MSAAFGFGSTAEQVTEGIDLRGTTWLVTGCNSGLGLETARVLTMRGAHVIGAARTEEKAVDALRSLGIDGTPVACELSDLDAVRRCVERVRAIGRPLAGIVANAGIMALPERRERYGVELQLLTNHVGHFVLVDGLVDQLADDGRVVVVSSAAHQMARERGLELDNVSGEHDYQPWRMYGRSKLANIVFARSLARRFAAAGSRRVANALHPGVIETNLGRHVPDAAAMYDGMRSRMKTVAQGAATQCYVAVRPELAGVSGRYFSDCAEAEPLPIALDDRQGDALWAATEAIVARAG